MCGLFEAPTDNATVALKRIVPIFVLPVRGLLVILISKSDIADSAHHDRGDLREMSMVVNESHSRRDLPFARGPDQNGSGPRKKTLEEHRLDLMQVERRRVIGTGNRGRHRTSALIYCCASTMLKSDGRSCAGDDRPVFAGQYFSANRRGVPGGAAVRNQGRRAT